MLLESKHKEPRPEKQARDSHTGLCMPGKEAQLPHVSFRKPWNGLAEKDRVSLCSLWMDRMGSSQELR